MYNGVGLPTPRGSGTSGYVQQNLAYVSRPRTWVDFKKEFEQIKANPPKPPKKPNAEIIEHEQKREIEVHLLRFRDKLEAEGLEEAMVEDRVDRAREYLYGKLRDAPLLSQSNSHQKVAEKEREMLRLKSAFGIMEDYVPGSAFDFEAIEEKQQKEKEDKQLKRALESRDREIAKIVANDIANMGIIEKPKEFARKTERKRSKSPRKPLKSTRKSRSRSRSAHKRRNATPDSSSSSSKSRSNDSRSSSSDSESSSRSSGRRRTSRRKEARGRERRQRTKRMR